MSLCVGSLPRGGGARGRGDQKLRWEGSAGAQTVFHFTSELGQGPGEAQGGPRKTPPPLLIYSSHLQDADVAEGQHGEAGWSCPRSLRSHAGKQSQPELDLEAAFANWWS